MKTGMKNRIAAWAVMGMTGLVFAQGSLTPPGAPGSMMKTLDQLDAAIAGVSNAVDTVEARIDLASVAGDANYHHIISQSGSYYLSGNLEVSQTHGILIAASDVTLDLNGFTVSRASGSGGRGFYLLSSADRVTLRNGYVSGFDYGVFCLETTDSVRLLNLTASTCNFYGFCLGAGSQIVDCIAMRNTGSGIGAGTGASLSGCIASYNQGTYGIYAASGSTLNGCAASNNQGKYGIYAGYGSTLNECVSSYNSSTEQYGYGIYATGGTVLNRCTASHNSGAGTYSYGIFAGDGSVVMECSSCYNSNTNSTSNSLQGAGIYASLRSTVQDCTVASNQGDGILVSSDVRVINNHCSFNGFNGDGAGIHALNLDNMIDGNTVRDNDRGIDVDSISNFIVRNTASGNTIDYTIAANNKVGVIVSAPNTTTAISGSSGGSGVGTTNPWANFSY